MSEIVLNHSLAANNGKKYHGQLFHATPCIVCVVIMQIQVYTYVRSRSRCSVRLQVAEVANVTSHGRIYLPVHTVYTVYTFISERHA